MLPAFALRREFIFVYYLASLPACSLSISPTMLDALRIGSIPRDGTRRPRPDVEHSSEWHVKTVKRLFSVLALALALARLWLQSLRQIKGATALTLLNAGPKNMPRSRVIPTNLKAICTYLRRTQAASS
ncbi:hypothetical protein BCR44DRAFT_1255414 [Catenaria anguillulae PL171]|uniref:Uncharacterized protein n=1 Tax=Catenaria anguillulae PL171 TaxID=765915 RepID=A0A1Y2HC15_9FUNG|nr:hypothetical protein BCR44DRAFT_1255414 [Catenaria anguillulae PL171]